MPTIRNTVTEMAMHNSRSRLDSFLNLRVNWRHAPPPEIRRHYRMETWNDIVGFYDPYTNLQWNLESEFVTVVFERFLEIVIPVCHSVRHLDVEAATRILRDTINEANHVVRRHEMRVREEQEIRRRVPDSIWFDEAANTPNHWADSMRYAMAANPFKSEEAEAARNKALATLKSALTPKQLDEFNANQTFKVSIQSGERKGTYEISNVRNYCVKHLETGDRYCVVTPEAPVYDQMLAIKLLLENEPETYFAKANKSSASRATTGTNSPFYLNLFTNLINRDAIG